MDREQRELFERIRNFRFDREGATATFANRLATENGWPAKYAARVIEEYRRFAFLAAVAGHPVSPPDAVDQAWHLHLVYTRSYWDEFCGKVLRTPLHHDPSRGGRDEKLKFVDWYARTLRSYHSFFGEAPPGDIWPTPAEKNRREARERHRRVDVARHWVIRKPRFRAAAGVAAVAASLAGLTTVGCASAGAGANGGGTVSPAVPIAFGVIAVGFFVVVSLLSRKYGRDRGGGWSGFFGGCGSSGGIGCGGRGDSCDHATGAGGADGGTSVDGGGGGASGCGSSGGGGCGGGCGGGS